MTTSEHVIVTEIDTLLAEQPAATLLGVKPRTLQAWRQRGDGPPFIKLSARAVRYRKRDLAAWVEARLQNNE